jgi:hypothetical protein
MQLETRTEPAEIGWEIGKWHRLVCVSREGRSEPLPYEMGEAMGAARPAGSAKFSDLEIYFWAIKWPFSQRFGGRLCLTLVRVRRRIAA